MCDSIHTPNDNDIYLVLNRIKLRSSKRAWLWHFDNTLSFFKKLSNNTNDPRYAEDESVIEITDDRIDIMEKRQNC